MRQFALRVLGLCALVVSASALTASTGCSTAPKSQDMASFDADANGALFWFQDNVPGLRDQIRGSAGYIVFPSVGQWGILFGGGEFGRGALNRPDGSRIGWAALNTASVGLQAGARGFKMLIVLEDQATLDQFMENQLSGSVSGVVVVTDAGYSARAPFTNGVAVYQGASTGLMAGVNVGLDYIR